MTKRALGRLAEVVARLFRSSPLTPLLEAEAMMAGIATKRRLWIALVRGLPERHALAGFDLDELRRRAEEQLALLEPFHEASAAGAFGRADPID